MKTARVLPFAKKPPAQVKQPSGLQITVNITVTRPGDDPKRA
jgi:hypothetical protein